jgi:hypothetical protein
LFRPEIELNVEGNSELVATIKDVRVEENPETKEMLKGSLGGLVLLEEGTDVLCQEFRKFGEEARYRKKMEEQSSEIMKKK